ncbi:putative solute carrier family 45 member 3, partial [Scophthalmus maximus]
TEVQLLCSVGMGRWVALLGARVVNISGVALLALAAAAAMSRSDGVTAVTRTVAVTGHMLCVLEVVPYTLLRLHHSNGHVGFFSPNPVQDLVCSTKVMTQSLPSRLTSSGDVTSVGLPHTSLIQGEDGRGEAGCTPARQRGMCYDVMILNSAFLVSQFRRSLI